MTFASIAAGVGAAASIGGAAAGAAGSSSAAKANQKIAQQQLDFQKQIYNQAQQNLNPYISFGQNALTGYGSALPSLTTPYSTAQYQQSPLYTPMVNNLAELQATPGYQFQLGQGEQAIQQSAAAQGGLLSGAAAKAMNDYAQNQASTGFQNAWQRAQTAYGTAFNQNLAQNQQISNIYNAASGMGSNAATALAGVGQNPAISNAYSNLGLANAAQAVSPYNMASGLAGGLTSSNLTDLYKAGQTIFG